MCLDRNVVRLVCGSPYIAWLPVIQSSNDLDVYPPCIDVDFHATSISMHTGNIEMYQKEKLCLETSSPANDAIKAHSEAEPIVLRNATHNVMSAVHIPGEVHSALDSSSISRLSQQYAHHFLHITCQQESRLPAKKKLASLCFILASGTTLKHGLGCSIWVCRFLPYLQLRDRSYRISSQHLFVVPASPRTLVVDIDAP